MLSIPPPLLVFALAMMLLRPASLPPVLLHL